MPVSVGDKFWAKLAAAVPALPRSAEGGRPRFLLGTPGTGTSFRAPDLSGFNLTSWRRFSLVTFGYRTSDSACCEEPREVLFVALLSRSSSVMSL